MYMAASREASIFCYRSRCDDSVAFTIIRYASKNGSYTKNEHGYDLAIFNAKTRLSMLTHTGSQGSVSKTLVMSRKIYKYTYNSPITHLNSPTTHTFITPISPQYLANIAQLGVLLVSYWCVIGVLDVKSI